MKFLADFFRKQKKKLDSDNIQSLPDAMATITLDGDSKDGCKEKAGLRHLTEEQGLFSFNRNPSTQGESLDVVQQLQNVLPEGKYCFVFVRFVVVLVMFFF